MHQSTYVIKRLGYDRGLKISSPKLMTRTQPAMSVSCRTSSPLTLWRLARALQAVK